MSYEIVKGIKIDNKNKKLFLRSSSNNVYPKTYSRWEYMANETDLEKKKRSLFYNIISGNVSLRICDNKNWRYASCRFFEYCKENNINIDDIWNSYHKNGNLEDIEEYYKIFEGFLNEEHKGLYYLTSNMGIVLNITHRGFLYSCLEKPKEKYCKDYKSIYLDRAKLSEGTINNYEIIINKYEKVNEQEISGDYSL